MDYTIINLQNKTSEQLLEMARAEYKRKTGYKPMIDSHFQSIGQHWGRLETTRDNGFNLVNSERGLTIYHECATCQRRYRANQYLWQVRHSKTHRETRR